MSNTTSCRCVSFHTVPFMINGNELQPEQVFDVISPSSGLTVDRCSSATLDHAREAVRSAAESYKTWRKTRPAQRRDIFSKAAGVIELRREESLVYIKDEISCSETWGNLNVNTAIDMIRDVAGRIASVQGTFPTTASPDTSSIVFEEPYGILLALVPWNAPYILGIRAIAFPIAAGNTVMFKGSNLPKGVLNVIFHTQDTAALTTRAIIRSPSVEKINFTGSTRVGRIISTLAAEALKPAVLELGGKCTQGAFLNAGQVCMATEKIVIYEAVWAEFGKKLILYANKAFPEQASLTLINQPAAVKVQQLIRDAVSKDARILSGLPAANESPCLRITPTILSNVSDVMDIYSVESFANDTEYGLSSAVFTEDLRRGLRFAREIEAGAFHINGMTIHDESALPYGGVKASGYRRFNASQGMAERTRSKTVTFND
ncbi:Vanillin dehydrogenase [Fusarium denticulatum]|uniref:Vanillin dehydrogenase n=1 Tax=Fusarium denticulatum TaxID=48507 RepID=A0A8H6CTQ8_9HYPO|nr:Vanillin dehydrogenase [Fusarium denticulatum]